MDIVFSFFGPIPLGDYEFEMAIHTYRPPVRRVWFFIRFKWFGWRRGGFYLRTLRFWRWQYSSCKEKFISLQDIGSLEDKP